MKYYNPAVQENTRKLFKFFSEHYFDIHIQGEENIPKNGSVIFSLNHVNLYDFIVVPGQIDQMNYFMANRIIFLPVFRKLLRALGVYPVNGVSEKKIFRKLAENYGLLIPKKEHEEFLTEINQYLLPEDSLKDFSTLDHKLFTEYVLSTGGCVVMYIPGTWRRTYDDIENPKKGAAHNALKMRTKHRIIVPVVPGAVVFSQDGKPIAKNKYALPYKSRVDISFGKAIIPDNFDEYEENESKAAEELTDIINDAVNAQVRLILERISQTD